MKLSEVAKVVRSKNAGPYELTLDILFNNEKDFNYFCQNRLINKALIARLYNISEQEIDAVIYFDLALAIKVTMKRWQVSGGVGEIDVYGAQQHAPLLTVDF